FFGARKTGRAVLRVGRGDVYKRGERGDNIGGGGERGGTGIRSEATEVLSGRTAVRGAGIGGEAGDSELHEAVGEVNGRGGESALPGVFPGQVPGAGGESYGAAVGGISAESGGVCADARDCAAGGRG